MAILLFTTTDLRGTRQAEFARLLASVAASQNTVGDIRHYLLLQNCSPTDLAARRASAPACCRLVASPGRLSVSAARNLMMKQALAEWSPTRGDIVGFPDDDCWLPDGFLERLARIFSERPGLDLLICRVSLEPDTEPFGCDAIAPASAREIVRISNSNNMFLRGSLVVPVGPFDTDLGLGTAAGGGEDTDYAVRAFLCGSEAGFIDRPLVGHPVPDRNAAIKYFQGALIVLASYARRRPALMQEFLRKLLVGLYFFAQGKLSAGTYRRALLDGIRAFRAAEARTGATA